MQRFWDKVNISNIDKCWEWTGSVNKSGFPYGRFAFNGKGYLAHRAAWMFSGHELKSNRQILHKCDNPRCVNPWHLSEGTHMDNMRDCSKKGRHFSSKKKACPRGHEYTKENTYLNKGRRVCRTCNRVTALKWKYSNRPPKKLLLK